MSNMEPRRDELTHDDIWDDSALIDSWNDALEEYKVSVNHTQPLITQHTRSVAQVAKVPVQKYHSIHAKGGAAVDDILAQAK